MKAEMEFLIAKTTVSGGKLKKHVIDAEHPCDLLASLPVTLCHKFYIQLYEKLHLCLWAKQRLHLSLVYRRVMESDYGMLGKTALRRILMGRVNKSWMPGGLGQLKFLL
jgi:hypothetical protein